MAIFTLSTVVANMNIRTVLNSFFRIQRKPDQHHRCLAPNNYISRAPLKCALSRSPLQPILISLQRTPTVGSNFRLFSSRSMQHGHSATSRYNDLRFYHSQALSIFRLERSAYAHVHIITSTCHHLEKEGPDAANVFAQKSRYTIRQRQYSIQPPLNAPRHFFMLRSSRRVKFATCVEAHLSLRQRS